MALKAKELGPLEVSRLTEPKLHFVGGVAGLALARALALKGAEVTVLEQAEAIREVGAGFVDTW